jgi:hypothetical protein
VKVRNAGVLAIAAAAGALAAAGPAMADVSVSPPSAPQATGSDLTFHVTNTGPSPMTRVKVALPADTAVAEIYPLSAADWAPQLTEKHLATPLTTIHGGTPVTDATASITWIAMPGKAIAPGASADLSVSIGPLPTTTSMDFLVTATYEGGKTGPAIPPVVLKLTPATAEELAAAHAGHDEAGTPGTTDGTGTDATDPDGAYFNAITQADDGPSWWSILGWVAAIALGAIALVMILRNRHRPADDEDEDDESADDSPGAEDDESNGREPVSAGAGKVKASSWRYSDGPDDE